MKLDFSIKFQYNSLVILSFFFISLFALILDYITKGNSNKKLFSCYRSSLLHPLTYFRFFGHIFGHDGWDHFKSNFLIILLVGPTLEEKYGSFEIMLMILLTAFVIGFIHNLASDTRLLGASGIAFMFIFLSSFVNIQEGTIPVTLVLIIMFYLIDEVKKGFSNSKDHVSHLGHFIGAVCGIGFGFYFLYHESLTEMFYLIINR